MVAVSWSSRNAFQTMSSLFFEVIFDSFLFIYRLFPGPKVRSSASVIVRGANYFMCDEIERSLHDALCVVKRVFESKSLVCGGGSVEAALSIILKIYADRYVLLFVLLLNLF